MLPMFPHTYEWVFNIGRFEPKPLVEPLGARVGWNHRQRDGNSTVRTLLDDFPDHRCADTPALQFRQDLQLDDVKGVRLRFQATNRRLGDLRLR